MLSCIMWISVAGIALVAGMMVQDRWIFSWADHPQVFSESERAVEGRVERAIERSFDKMQVVDSEGREVDVPAQTKRELAEAVGELVKAETEFALARVSDDSDAERQAAAARRDHARADVNRLRSRIESFERAERSGNDALREQIRREIEEDVRASVSNAVGN